MATNTNTIKTPRRKKAFTTSEFFSTNVSVDSKFVTVTLPAKLARQLELKNGETVFWTVADGVVQISPKEPHVVIPMMHVTSSAFQPQ